MSVPSPPYHESSQKTRGRTRKTSDLRKMPAADLLAEQAAIVQRLAEITAQLNGQPTPSIPERRPPLPEDFSWPAYALGLLFEQPEMTATELAARVGVTRSSLYTAPKWSKVAKFLRARQSNHRSERREHFASVDDI